MNEVATPRRRPIIFYGWYIVGVAVIAQFVSAGVQAYAIGVFLKPMIQEFGWSRESFSAVQSIATAVMGAIGFFLGGLIDRRGPRLLMVVGGLISGCALLATSHVTSLWQFYLLRGVAQTVGMAMVGNLVVNVTLAKWFVARRGMAISIASLGISLGGVVLTPVVAWWVESYGWRMTWTLLGFMVWLLVLPAALLMRRAPEDAGLLPDGMSEEEARVYSATHKRASAISEVQWTRAEAVRTGALWLVIFAYGTALMGLSALLLHLFPFLTDTGFGGSTAAVLFAVYAWAALLCKPVWGLLMDRFHARYLSALGFGLSAVCIIGLLAATAVRSVALVSVALAGYGFAIGGMVALQEIVWAGYFGRAHLGEIRAIGMPFTILFSAGGPLLAGVLYDRSGSYSAAFLIFAAFSLVGLVLILAARPPQRRAVVSSV